MAACNCKMPTSNPCKNVPPACIPQEMEITNVRLAAAYVPYQFLCQLYSPIDALRRGTAFPELFSPYDAGRDTSCGCMR